MHLQSNKNTVYFVKKFRNEFSKSSSSEASFYAISQILSGVLLISTSIYLINISTVIGWLLYPVLIYFVGTRYRALVNIMHECVHNTFCEIKSLNTFYGEFLSIICFMRFTGYKENHVTHHMYTGDQEKDLGFSHLNYYEFDVPLERSVTKRHFGRLFTLQMFKDYLGYVIFDKSASGRWRLARLAWLTTLLGLCIYSGWNGTITFVILAFVIVPRLIALPIIGYISDILDHGGMLGHEHDVDKSRNYIVKNRFIAEAFFPRNDCYHLIHHLFPTVPAKWMPRAHEILLSENPEYRQLTHSFKDWVRIALSQKSALAY